MREIEFRAWDKTRSCFIEVPDIKDLLFSYGANYDYTNGDDVEIIQYTGLKDRNGVKIFEGDIVSVRYCDDDDVSIGKVAWMDCYYPAFDIYVPSDRAASGFEPYHDEFNSFSCPDFIIQVIGNIYQNP